MLLVWFHFETYVVVWKESCGLQWDWKQNQSTSPRCLKSQVAVLDCNQILVREGRVVAL